MKLFESETFTVTKIHSVNLHETKECDLGKTMKYNPKLTVNELVFFFSGRHETTFGKTFITDTAGTIRFMPKNQNCSEYTVKNFEQGFCIDIYFDSNDDLPTTAVSIKNIKELRSSFTKLHNIWTAKKPGYYARAMSVMYEIIEKIKSHNEKYQTASQAQKILPSVEYAHEHFCQSNFDFKQMCATTGLSYDYFKSLFIKKHGVSPVKYVTALRLDKAKELLITGHFGVGEIAVMCGFENTYYFSNVFKKHFGVSPKNYKPN